MVFAHVCTVNILNVAYFQATDMISLNMELGKDAQNHTII